jgi:hypothetical protein
MFIELMPLIEKRAITITVAALKDGHVRVNVVPTALAEDSKVNEKIGYSNKDKITLHGIWSNRAVREIDVSSPKPRGQECGHPFNQTKRSLLGLALRRNGHLQGCRLPHKLFRECRACR